MLLGSEVCLPNRFAARQIAGLDHSVTAKGVAVARYDYRCDDCGALEVSAAMGAAPRSVACPCCGQEARRVYSAPLIARTPKALAAMRAREERSRDNPEVASSVPPRSRPSPPRSQPAGRPALPRW